MYRVLIIGASVLQLPAILKSKELGYYVAVVDMNPNAVGVKFADVFFEVSTNDIEGIVGAADKFNPDGVLTLATDMPLRSVSEVAHRFNLPGISVDVAIRATDKIAMIECFKQNNVPHPWFYKICSDSEFEEVLKTLRTPFIIKPNDSSGSRGVVLVQRIEDAFNGFKYSRSVSKSGFVLLEEYLNGPEVSVETITIDGETHILAITDKITTGAPHFVEMGHSQPSSLPLGIQDKIKDVAIKAINAIGINNSPAHVEIIITSSGPKLVEIGARLGGDCITSHLVPFSTGIDMVKATIDLALGIKPNVLPKYQKGAAIRYLRGDEGYFVGVEGIDEILKNEFIRHIEIVKAPGDFIKPIHASGDRVGYVITQAENVDKAKSICEAAVESLQILTKK